MIIKSEVQEVIKILKSLGIPFYFHAGFALHLWGMDGELNDCDIRIYHPDIKEVYKKVKKQSPYLVRLRGAKSYGKGTYDNLCIEILGKTYFDICSRMVTNCDIGRFEFPFNINTFSDITSLPYENINLPVASLESLFLYYLVLRRDYIDEKNDEKRVRDLIVSNKFSRQKFEQILLTLPLREKIKELYLSAISKYGKSSVQKSI